MGAWGGLGNQSQHVTTGSGVQDQNVWAEQTPSAVQARAAAASAGASYKNAVGSNARRQAIMNALGGRTVTSMGSPDGYIVASPISGEASNRFLTAALPDMGVSYLTQIGLAPDQLARQYARPEIDTGPIWDEGEIQRQVNALRATSAAETDRASRLVNDKFAGAGFGAVSPVAMAVRQNLEASRIAGDSSAERQARWDAATGNAAFRQQGQIAMGQLSADYLRALIAAQQNFLQTYTQQQQARANLLSNMIGAIG